MLESIPSRPSDEVYTNLYLGGLSDINPDNIKEKGFTHILSCAYEISDLNLFPDDVIVFYIPLKDIPSQSLLSYLDHSFEFIDKALKNNGKVLVHCRMGISRSASLVIYYLMRKKKMPYNKALRFVRSNRAIVSPNIGFEEQLKKINFK